MASESIGSPLRSRNAAVEVVVDNNKPERGGAAPHRSSSSKLGLSSADLCDRSSKSDGKRLLIHTDSGYISPTVAPASNGNSPQTPSKELPQIVKFQTGTAASEEKDTEKLNHKTETSMQSVLSARSAPSRESQVDYRRRSLPAESVSSLLLFMLLKIGLCIFFVALYVCLYKSENVWVVALYMGRT